MWNSRKTRVHLATQQSPYQRNRALIEKLEWDKKFIQVKRDFVLNSKTIEKNILTPKVGVGAFFAPRSGAESAAQDELVQEQDSKPSGNIIKTSRPTKKNQSFLNTTLLEESFDDACKAGTGGSTGKEAAVACKSGQSARANHSAVAEINGERTTTSATANDEGLNDDDQDGATIRETRLDRAEDSNPSTTVSKVARTTTKNTNQWTSNTQEDQELFQLLPQTRNQEYGLDIGKILQQKDNSASTTKKKRKWRLWRFLRAENSELTEYSETYLRMYGHSPWWRPVQTWKLKPAALMQRVKSVQSNKKGNNNKPVAGGAGGISGKPTSAGLAAGATTSAAPSPVKQEKK
ncbi:unnamed protein product [Amoebophrya sp. A120]|nr:unnamed protein product [Amoebophrya sp. A120]|eukprot:GSA120T00024174001.1